MAIPCWCPQPKGARAQKDGQHKLLYKEADPPLPPRKKKCAEETKVFNIKEPYLVLLMGMCSEPALC